MGNGPKVKPHNDHVGYHGRPVMGPPAARMPHEYHKPGTAGQGPRVSRHNDHGGYHGRPHANEMPMKPPPAYAHARSTPQFNTGKSMASPKGKPGLRSSKAD